MKTIIKMLFRNFLASFVLTASVNAQDIHFSQFSQTPLLLNPALTGVFNGDQRVYLNYKDQWKSVTTPYKTAAVSIDAGLMKKKWEKAFLGAGLFVYNDKAGDASLATTQINLSVSSIIALSENHKVSAGLQGGYAQRSISPSNQKWDNQWNGSSFDPNANSGETNNFSSFGFGDFTAGANYNFSNSSSTMSSNDRLAINIGAAYHHLNKPQQVFVNADKLHSKLSVYADGFIGIKNFNLAIVPSVMVLSQGPSKEINAGTMIRYTIQEGSRFTGIFKELAVSMGGYYRVKDAIVPTFLIEYANYAIGMSYDVNISSLKTASGGRGGFEIMLRYINPNPFKTQSGTGVRFL
jgi:type IX secretion system PorP/SprF family membrane protein